MINLAIQRATVAVNQNKPEDAEPPLVEALDAVRRAGQEDVMLSATLAGVYALQKKFDQAESAIRPVLAKPEAWNALGPNIVPFALRSLGAAYRNDGKLAEAESYYARLCSVRSSPAR
jgi:tetratricopeptide (TPR) repeat protein